MELQKNIPQTLHRIIFEETIENHTHDGENLVKIKTPDYSRLNQATKELIQSPKDLEGEYKGWDTSTLVKISIEGGFSQNLSLPANSPENYQMIQQIRKNTKENKEFWEEPVKNPPKNFLMALASKPAAAIVASRMSLEPFSLGLKNEDPQALQEAAKTAKLFEDCPAFLSELSAMRKFSQLEEILTENLKEKEQNLKIIRKTAKAIVKKDFQTLCSWNGNNLTLEIETAIKLALFTGKSGSPTLDNLIQEEKMALKKTWETQEPEI